MSDITLYTCGTPNGYKVSIFLEVLGLKYDVKALNIMTNVQKESWFTDLNPNGRIPTLVDHKTGITISETAAIMTYLADTYDKDHLYSFAAGTEEYYKHMEVVYFQMAGIGPMQGQAHHFILYAPEKVPYGMKRYSEETKRLYGVFNEYLERNKANGPYAVGNHYSIADFTILPWAMRLHTIDVDIKQFPNVYKWAKTLMEVPEVNKGFQVPTPCPLPSL